ncbi:MAG: hypothetical protein U0517_04610 [Candidatus Andersenbacteria bacterium]
MNNKITAPSMSSKKQLEKLGATLLKLQKKSEENQKKIINSNRWIIENQTLELRKLRGELKQGLEAIRSEMALFGNHEQRISRLEKKS